MLDGVFGEANYNSAEMTVYYIAASEHTADLVQKMADAAISGCHPQVLCGLAQFLMQTVYYDKMPSNHDPNEILDKVRELVDFSINSRPGQSATIVELNVLANSYMVAQHGEPRFKEALSTYQKALDLPHIQSSATGQALARATLLANMAVPMECLNRVEEALEVSKEAQSVFAEAKILSDPNLAMLHDSMAKIHEKLSDETSALASSWKAYLMLHDTVGPYDSRTIDATVGLCHLLAKQHDLVQALGLLDKARKDCETVYGGNTSYYKNVVLLQNDLQKHESRPMDTRYQGDRHDQHQPNTLQRVTSCAAVDHFVTWQDELEWEQERERQLCIRQGKRRRAKLQNQNETTDL